MKFPSPAFILAVLTWCNAIVSGAAQWPVHTDGLNSDVEWDHYSYIVNGERLFVWSGEFHYWRIPVPELWIDILQKVKALGFNTVSLYGHWGYHSASESSLDFESGAHNFTRILESAKEIGLYVLFRPGPYINAETTAGGFPGWTTTGAYGSLRNDDPRYTDAWTPYWTKMSEIIAAHQVSNGGSVLIYQIENEYGYQFTSQGAKTPNNTGIDYMELLEASARSNGVDIPLIQNNPNPNSYSWSQDYSDLGGNVDIFGFDSYPSCWTCDLTQCGSVPEFNVQDYYSHFQAASPTQPSFLAEFQGGSFNPWGGPQGGCGNNSGPDWVNVFYRHNIGQKVSAMNIYMVFGGTNWGGLAFPQVGTSYDYSSPIGESRVLGDKYYETKILAQFIRVARDLTKVDVVNNSTNSTAYASTPLISISELRNPDTKSAFYVTIHTSSPSTALTPFKLEVTTSEGNFTVPQYASTIVLNGRESKIIVTDFSTGDEKLVYSTAEVLTVSVQDGKPIIFLWLPAGESGEFFLTGVRRGQVSRSTAASNVHFTSTKGGFVVSYTQGAGSSTIEFDNGYRVVVLDRAAAYYTWNPTTSTDPYSPENSTVVVQGPYLVRSASIQHGTLSLTGDWSNTTNVEVYAPSSVHSITFNDAPLKVTKTPYGSFLGQLQGSRNMAATIESSLPALTQWKVQNGLPERDPLYDDSKWVVADHSTTPAPSKPETYPVLYSDDYGFHTGTLLWRGRFNGGNATGVHLRVIGGFNFGFSAFLNGAFIGSWLGNTTATDSTLNLSFSNATLAPANNVLLVIQDYMGKDETTGVLNPRGILNASLLGGSNFTSWKVAGNAGGEANIDPIRGPLAEGGLHAERLGWHLPGYHDGKWEVGSPVTGFEGAGARFYRTVVELDLPGGMDTSLGFTLNAPAGSKLRAQLYVNGYQFAKFVPWIGNQIVYPVFPGILDYHGENTIGLSVWAQSDEGGSVSVGWTVLGAVESSYDPGALDTSYLRPGWTDRSAYY